MYRRPVYGGLVLRRGPDAPVSNVAMASITYFAALPFVRNEEGDLCPDEATECTSSTAAVARARALATTKAGAIAFSRTGDPQLGEWADAVILLQVGDTPADLEALTGA